MVLVHDDDLAWLDGICDITVGWSFTYNSCRCINVFLFQQLGLDAMLAHIQNLKPTPYNAQIGEFFHYCNFSLLTTEVSTWRFVVRSESQVEFTWAATLSDNGLLGLYFCYIASDSSLRISRQNVVNPRRTLSPTTAFLYSCQFFVCLYPCPFPSSPSLFPPHFHSSYFCSGWLRLRMPGQRQRKLVNIVDTFQAQRGDKSHATP